MRKSLLVALFAMITIAGFSQQRNFWTAVDERSINDAAFAGRARPNEFKVFRLNESQFKSSLAVAPSERNVNAAASAFILTIPNSDGELEQFRIVEAPVMAPELAARYPGITSYAGQGITDPTASIRFDVSPQGFHGMILSSTRPTVYIDPLVDENYIVVSRKEILQFRPVFECLTQSSPSQELERVAENAERNADDGQLRTYRLALCASGEFSQYWLNGTETTDAERKAKVLAAQNTAMTRANGIFERDFGLRLVLIANNDAVIYLNPSTDPWTSNNLNSATQSTCNNVIGSANYDIGHLVHRASDNGNAGCIGCVCNNSNKGSGFTSYLNLTSDFFVVDYLTHEMGHQLGGNHTFTFSNEGTIAQVEPGSGSTIMGYAGITGSTDVQPHSDDYFHAISIQQITNYIKSANGSCAVETVTGNNTPTANAGSSYTIPRSTPFKLTGSGTDADAGDGLTYCWEQMNVRGTGTSTIPSATATSGPQFRSYLPTTSTSRTIPVLSSILSGSNSNQWEVLPSVARTLNFRFTVRDNHPGGGNNNSADMVVTVSGTTGPFLVTAPNTTGISWGVGTSQNVTWSVNGTAGSPVNCTAVNILLSTDGGQTFPITLAANTANDGTESITVPNNPGTTNRIKVEAVGNIFFDINNSNFAIGSAPACSNPSNLTTTSITTNSATVNWSAVSGASSYDVDYKQSTSGTWINAATATASTSVNLSGLSASTNYDWRVRANCSSASSTYSSSTFTTAGTSSPCPGPYDVSTNGSTGGAATIPFNTDIKGTLSPRGDNDYYRFDVTTGGTVTISLTTLPANYQLTLLNAGGTVIGSSGNNGTTAETINATLGAGAYYTRVYPKGNASNASSCYTLRVQTGTASREGNELYTGNFNIKAYPNPAGPVLELRAAGTVTKASLQVFDMNGKVVLRNVMISNQKQLDISKLSPGVYLLSINENGFTQRIPFVKN
jgi:hypothetical protein